MKKFALFVFGVVALVGMLNCTIIEPAFAYQDECAATCQDATHCSLCHFSHHQWVNPQNLASAVSLLPARVISLEMQNVVLESPQGSIFHPPIAL